MFQEKDFLNHRYFFKRAIYLAHLASILTTTSKKPTSSKADKKTKNAAITAKDNNGSSLLETLDVSFEWMNGDERRPILVLQGPLPTSKSKIVRIRILPLLSEKSAIPLQKLGPMRNSVRPAAADNNNNPTSSSSISTTSPLFPATPKYNSSLLQDTAYVHSLNYIHSAIKTCDGFADAVKLGKVWLRQRGFVSSSSFGFIWTICMAWLLQTKRNGGKMSNRASSFQLFKSTMDFLAKFNFKDDALFLTPDCKESSHSEVKDWARGVFFGVGQSLTLFFFDLVFQDSI